MSLVLYKVIVSIRAQKRIRKCVQYVEDQFGYPETADSVHDRIWDMIESLDKDPGRGALRKVGRYANKGYHQVFAGEYIIVYRIDEAHARLVAFPDDRKTVYTILNLRALHIT